VSAAPREGIDAIRAAAALLAERAALVPSGPWYLKQVIGRTAICDAAGHVITWIPDASGAGIAGFLVLRDPESAQFEAALLNAIADGAEHLLRFVYYATPADLAKLHGFTGALALAEHILEVPS
jgi:hypothetical protein